MEVLEVEKHIVSEIMHEAGINALVLISKFGFLLLENSKEANCVFIVSAGEDSAINLIKFEGDNLSIIRSFA